MTVKSLIAASLLAAVSGFGLDVFPGAPAFAGEGRTIVMTAKPNQARAVRDTLRAYSWAQGTSQSNAIVDQRGSRNAAGVVQHGSGNLAIVGQRGRNNSANLAQTGNNNALAVFQVGHNRQVDASQIGNGKTAIIVQAGR